MYVVNVADYGKITSNSMTLSNCTNNDNNIEIIVLLFTIIPCGMSLMCSTYLMVYTLVKHLIIKKQNFL